MRVQVHLRAENLGNIAKGRWCGKTSSPYAALSSPSLDGASSTATATATGAVELGKTEIIPHNLNPEWTKIFILDHDENRSWTPLKISLRDCRGYAHSADDGNCREDGYKSSDPTMGEADVEAGAILRMEEQEQKVELTHGGCLYVHITESVVKIDPSNSITGESVTGDFHCRLRGLDLENIEKGFLGLGAIDPYFVLSKRYSDPTSGFQRWVRVYQSEHVPDIINPYWEPFRLSAESLCHGDPRRELRIEVWDHENGSTPDRWLGDCETSVKELRKSVSRAGNASREHALHLMNQDHDEIGLIVVLKA